MSATSERDRVNSLAKSDSRKALGKARGIGEAWFRAQALAWVARFADEDPRGIAREAAKAAGECDDAYKRSAVRAWEIAALAEREFKAEARESLDEAVALGKEVTPFRRGVKRCICCCRRPAGSAQRRQRECMKCWWRRVLLKRTGDASGRCVMAERLLQGS